MEVICIVFVSYIQLWYYDFPHRLILVAIRHQKMSLSRTIWRKKDRLQNERQLDTEIEPTSDFTHFMKLSSVSSWFDISKKALQLYNQRVFSYLWAFNVNNWDVKITTISEIYIIIVHFIFISIILAYLVIENNWKFIRLYIFCHLISTFTLHFQGRTIEELFATTRSPLKGVIWLRRYTRGSSEHEYNIGGM